MATKESGTSAGDLASSLTKHQLANEEDYVFEASLLSTDGYHAKVVINDGGQEERIIMALDKMIRAFIRTYF